MQLKVVQSMLSKAMIINNFLYVISGNVLSRDECLITLLNLYDYASAASYYFVEAWARSVSVTQVKFSIDI